MNDVNLKSALERIDFLEKELADCKLAEAMVQQECDFSNQLVDNAPLIIMVLNPQGKIIRFNHYMEILTGYSSKEVKGKDWFSTFLPEDQREKTREVFLMAIDDIQTDGNVNPIVTKDGSQRVIEWYDKTLKDRQNNIIGLLSMGLDVTERIRAEESLRNSEARFRTLVESTSDWIWEVDQKGIYTYVSPKIETLLGYKPEEVLGKSPFDFMPPNEVQRISNAFKELLDKRAPLTALKNANLCKDGRLKILETSGVPFFNENGEFAGYRGIDRDVTERQRVEQALHNSEEKFYSITASAQDAILMMDDKGNISYWNKAAEKIFGYLTEEVMGQSLHTLIAPQRFLAAHRIGFEHFKKTGEGPAVGKTLELAALKKDGTEFPIELSLSAVMRGGRWSAIGIIRDITQRKEMEKELKYKDEMMITQAKQAAMGDMIAMIAHQWRQPLAIIGMDLNNLMMSIAFEEEITTDYLVQLSESLNKQLQQLSETIDNFRNFFKPNQAKEQTTIEDVLKSTLSIIGTSFENNNITVNINNTVKSSLLINKSSLIQVLLNMLGNAKDVILANKVTQPIINVTVNETKEAITITICDNAGGIPESVMEKIGQPYFTTKQEFNGTGLGIYISRTILEKHLCGTLTWHNEGQGACFVITLKNSMKNS